MSSKPPLPNQEEIFSSDEDDVRIKRDTTKRKAPTEHTNSDFVEKLKCRNVTQSQDFKKSNV